MPDDPAVRLQIRRVSALFNQLIDDALGEIARREPSYFERFSLTFPTPAARVEIYRNQPAFQAFSPAEIASGIEAGLEYVAEQGVDVRTGDEDDPVALLMLDSIMDAFAADRQALPLRPNTQPPRSLDRILREDHEERRTPEGGRYFIRKTGNRPLVLISACGIPLGIWSNFLGDRSHEFKTIVVESRTADALLGGMKNCVDLSVDSADIIAVLDCEHVGKIDALAWCSGGRIAINIADRYADRLGSLTLLSPTLHGMAGMAPQPSPFEDTMCEIFEALTERPQQAEYFAGTFRDQSQVVNWDIVGGKPSRRAAALFGLAATEHSKAMLTPMLRPDSLVNYGRRVAFDESYAANEALSRLALPVLVLTGDHDTIVNTAFSCAALRTWGPPMVHASVKGGGHYLQDLQYTYFLSILSEFLAARQPRTSARVEVMPLVNARQDSVSGERALHRA
jgi:pimeloyl-ACP methyl ester carboxylesterase